MCWDNYRYGNSTMKTMYTILMIFVLGGPAMFACGGWLLASPHTIIVRDVTPGGGAGAPGLGPQRTVMDQEQRDTGITLVILGYIITALALTALFVLCCRPKKYGDMDDGHQNDLPHRWSTVGQAGTSGPNQSASPATFQQMNRQQQQPSAFTVQGAQ